MKYIFIFLLATSFCAFGQEKELEKLEKMLGSALKPVVLSEVDWTDPSNLPTPLPSLVNDTVLVGQEFNGVFTQSSYEDSRRSGSSFLVENPISKKDYLDFCQWVRDSIAREAIFFGLEDSEEASQWISYEEVHRDPFSSKLVQFDSDIRDVNRRIFPLNWSKKLVYDDLKFVPILDFLYFQRPEVFRGTNEFDYRRLYYTRLGKYSGSSFRVPVWINDYQWVKKSDHNFGVTAVMSFLNHEILLDSPVSHIQPFMAKAYCNWKTDRLNQELKVKGLRVKCRLPYHRELVSNQDITKTSLTISGYDHTDHWRITNKEFHEFCEDAVDSLVREYFYANESDELLSLQMLNYQRYYYSSDDLEYVELDPSKRAINRLYFTLNKKAKIKWYKFGFTDRRGLLDSLKIDSVAFRYQWMDAKSRAFNPNGVAKIRVDGRVGSNIGSGVMMYGNLQAFLNETVTMIPIPDGLLQDEQIADISYDQALAYYNWKYRIDLFNSDIDDDWQRFIFPTEEEFTRIKNGETLNYPAREIEYESPLFKMVIELTSTN